MHCYRHILAAQVECMTTNGGQCQDWIKQQ